MKTCGISALATNEKLKQDAQTHASDTSEAMSVLHMT